MLIELSPVAEADAGAEEGEILVVLGQDGILWFLSPVDGSVWMTLGPPQDDFIDNFVTGANGR